MSEPAAGGIPVAVACRVLRLSRQPCHRWLADPVTDSEVVQAYRAHALADAHRDDPELGYRLLADETRAAGRPVCDRTAWKITSANGWFGAFGRGGRGRGTRHGPPVHDDLVERVFAADGPNRLWLTDITEHPTAAGKPYLCAAEDVFSNKVAGCCTDSTTRSPLAVDAPDNAVATPDDVAGCTVHSDRGSQLRSRKLLRALARHRLVGSMGRVGAAGDDAATESFFSLLQKNVLDRRSWATRQEPRIAIVTWIERTYHRRRHQARLGRSTPTELEAVMTTPANLAA